MAWLPFAKLEITDGTTTVNLLNQQASGFLITDWQPAIQDLKAGGTWADSPMADERELIVSQLANVEDQFTFDVSAATTDELIGYLRALRALLVKARQYTTTTWQDTVVYLVAQGYGDTNARYTRVKNWRTPADGFPYGPPMWDTIQGTAINDFQLIIEHGAWLENAPGVGTAVEISAVETFDGRNLGNVDDTGTRDPTTANEVYVASGDKKSNITHVFIDSGGFGPNLMNAGLPYSLFPAVPAPGDILYIGTDSTIADSGPFSSVVFDIGTAQNNLTLRLDIWEGAWNVASVITDHTANFTNTGVNSVHFRPSVNTVAVNFVTGFWIRYVVTAVGGAPAPPTQQHRDIYTISWANVEIESAQCPGDIAMPAVIKLYAERATTEDAAEFRRIIAGSRSYDRGADFTAYLNCADEQNPAGVTVAVGVNTVFADETRANPGRAAYYSSAIVEAMLTRVTITLNSALSQQFKGEYHAYLRLFSGGFGAGEVFIQLQVRSGGGGITVTNPTTITADGGAVDFGKITLPTSDFGNNQVDQTEFFIQLEHTVAVGIFVYFLDLVLIPVDEWAVDTHDLVLDANSKILTDEYLAIDAISYPKAGISSIVKSDTTNLATVRWLTITNSRQMLQSNAKQSLWFLFGDDQSPAISFSSSPEYACRVLIERQAQYHSMRGSG
jgi:hypothetical protein